MKRGTFWVVVICLIVTSLVLASCATSTASNSTATSTATLKSTATATKTTPAAATKYSVQELNYLTDKEILAVCQKYVTCDGIVLKAVEPDTLAHQGYTWMRKIQILRGAISSLHSCIADMFFLKIAFNDTRLLLAAS